MPRYFTIMQHRLLLLIISFGLIASSTYFLYQPGSRAAALPTTVTLKPTADAYVNQAFPNGAYGAASALRVDGSPVTHSYLRFSVPALSGTVTSATLRIYAISPQSTGFTVHRVTNTTWDERTITASNAPGFNSGSVGASGPIPKGAWVSVNVTALVTGAGDVNLALKTDNPSQAQLASRESGATAPQLVVSTGASVSEPTTPTTATATATATTTTTTTPAAATAGSKKVYAFYYLWWSRQHWRDKLGSNYPYSANPLPLPATLDSNGCNPKSLYPGNQLTDAPAQLFGQDDPGVIENDVRKAASAGLAGFIATWRGTGQANQQTNDVSYNRRLAELVRAVNQVNAEGIPFKLWFSYETAQNPTTQEMINDLSYLQRVFSADPAFDRSYSNRPLLIWNDSGTYSTTVLSTVSQQFRSTFFILGNEKWSTWSNTRAQYLDGFQYYWSTQDPYGNPQSFDQLKSLADKVRASGANPDGSKKLWFAPLTPGYDSILLDGRTCVPRKGGQTMRDLFAGNSATNPDGWTFISWNEIAEGSYIVPLQRYGDTYLNVLKSIIQGQ